MSLVVGSFGYTVGLMMGELPQLTPCLRGRHDIGLEYLQNLLVEALHGRIDDADEAGLLGAPPGAHAGRQGEAEEAVCAPSAGTRPGSA